MERGFSRGFQSVNIESIAMLIDGENVFNLDCGFVHPGARNRAIGRGSIGRQPHAIVRACGRSPAHARRPPSSLDQLFSECFEIGIVWHSLQPGVKVDVADLTPIRENCKAHTNEEWS